MSRVAFLAASLLLLSGLSSAQAETAHPKYVVVQLGSLGGTVGRSNAVNDRGWVSGWWNLPGDASHHAALWLNGKATDLGTLGGPSSEVEYIETNEFGMLAGGSDTSTVDPNGENFCILTYPDQKECSAFRWENGTMTALPGLGGNSSYGANSNRWGHIVGWAETTLDPNCIAPQVFDTHGALWSGNSVRDLPPLPGDAVSAAIAINDYDVAAGGSGYCGSPGILGFSLLTHAVIWRKGVPTDLGSLGGQFNNTATDNNNLGQVVGMSDLRGDAVTHAVLWQNGSIHDLGTLPGDLFSFAWAISKDGKVILGQSCDASGNCRGFLWQNGVMTDVNTLIPAGSQLIIIDANDINAAGDITGQAYDPVTGEMPAIEMIPCTQTENSECGSKPRTATTVTLPQTVRDTLEKRRLHFHK